MTDSELIREAEAWAREEDPENARLLRRLIARARLADLDFKPVPLTPGSKTICAYQVDAIAYETAVEIAEEADRS